MVLYSLYFLFASFGMAVFGGVINTNSWVEIQEKEPDIPAEYIMINFNDFGNSYIFLFVIMITNNW